MTEPQDNAWRQPLQGEHLYATPMTQASDWAKFHQHAQAPEVFELAIGMGAAPTAEVLNRDTAASLGTSVANSGSRVANPDIIVWEAFDLQKRHVGYLIYSTWTALPTIGASLFETPPDIDLWRDGISMLSDVFFAAQSQRHNLYVHLPPPVDASTDGLLVELGFAPVDQSWFIGERERVIYGLVREIYSQFHETFEDDEDLDGF